MLLEKNPPANARYKKRHAFYLWVKKIPWSRKWHPTPLLLLGKFRGHWSLAVCSPWGHKESDTSEHLNTHTHTHRIFLCFVISPLRVSNYNLLSTCKNISIWENKDENIQHKWRCGETGTCKAVCGIRNCVKTLIIIKYHLLGELHGCRDPWKLIQVFSLSCDFADLPVQK